MLCLDSKCSFGKIQKNMNKQDISFALIPIVLSAKSQT